MMTGYNYDAITNTLTMTASFAKKASQLNTPEYNTVRQLRLDNPGMKIEKAIRKIPSNQPMNATFAQMEGFIAKCANSEERLDVFEKIKALSKIQASPYAYVRKWFLENYANYSEQPEFDAKGFVIAKTKSQMEAEKKAKAQEEAKRAEEVAAAEAQEVTDVQEQEIEEIAS